MGGDATISGTTYQAGVVAFVYVHMLLEQRLGWFELFDDRPVAIEGEVNGPGDDVRVDFGPGTPSAEIQAKHGLVGLVALGQVLDRVREFPEKPGSPRPVVLAVNRASSKWLYTTLAEDLDRLRSGRSDVFRAEARKILADLDPDGVAALSRIHVKELDVDALDDPEAKWAITALQQILANSDHAEAAWRLLRDDADTLCRTRLRRSRADITALLATEGIRINPPQPIAQLNRELDLSKAFLERHKPHAALLLLAEIEKRLDSANADGPTRYRFFQQRGSAYLQLTRFEDALELSRKALDHNPTGVHALVVAALASMSLGDVDTGMRFAEDATNAHPQDYSAWIARTQTGSSAGVAIPAPPPFVASSREYRLGIVQVRLNEGNVREAFALTTELLNEGVRTSNLVLFRAEALMTLDSGEVAVFNPTTAGEIERLTTEVIESDPSDDTMRRALLARAIALRALDRPSDADADTRHARQLEPDDPHAMSQAAQTEIVDGDFDSARRILASPVVERYPFLLALRGAVLANLGEFDAAKKDINEALRRLTDAHDPDAVRLTAADAALDARDIDLAERALVGLSRAASESGKHGLVRGRIAFHKGDIPLGAQLFEDAAAQEPKLAPACFAELGARLMLARRPEEAVIAFEKSIPRPTKVLAQYVRALIATNRLQAADALIEPQLSFDSPPDWALDAAVHIALVQEDLDKAAEHLQRLTNRPSATPAARLELARLLIQLGRENDATPVLEVLAKDIEQLEPREQMVLAHAFHAVGQAERALGVAFVAYRHDDNDPDLHRGLATLALFSGIPLPKVEAVGPDTYVRLKNTSTGAILEYTILARQPVRAKDHQLLIDDAAKIDLVGLRVGDIAAVKQTWAQGQWRVDELKPAIQDVVQDIMAHYEDRFPTEPFFVAGFSIGKAERVADFAPMIGQLHAQQTHRKEIVRLYLQRTLAIGFIATSTGATISEVMDHLSRGDDGARIYAEWLDREGQQKSLAAVADSKRIVLTESALHTAQRLGILQLLAQRYALLAPRSLRSSLRERFDELEDMATKGHKMVSAEGPGLRLHEWPAGDPSIVEARNRQRELLQWLGEHAALEPRPLESISGKSEETRTREIIGHSSFDSVALAVHHRVAMYADDLGLRGLVLAANGISFSTASLLLGLVESKEMLRDEAESHLETLIERRYFVVPLSSSLLNRLVTSLTGDRLVDAVANLAPPALSPQDASRIGVETLKWIATTPFLAVSLQAATAAILSGMSRYWPKPLCAHSLLRAALNEFALLPNQLDAVARACRDFVRPV